MKTAQTLQIETILREGKQTITAIAHRFGLTNSRVRSIKQHSRRAEVRELWNVDEVLRKPSTSQGHGWVI